jgi:hypothetical protein
VSGAEGKGLEGEGREVERRSCRVAVGQVKGQVLFGGLGKIEDPEFTGAILYGSVVRLVIKQKAAVFHGRIPRWLGG